MAAGAHINEEPIRSKCSPVVLGSRKEWQLFGQVDVRKRFGRAAEKQTPAQFDKVQSKRQGQLKTPLAALHLKVFSPLCYFQQEKQAYFAAKSPVTQITVAGLWPPGQQVNHAQQTTVKPQISVQ